MTVRNLRAPIVLLGSLAALLAPGIAAACSVCMTGKEDDTRIAFELMTAFMTVVPFVLVGGVFWWLRGRLREVEDAHKRAREESSLAKDDGSCSSVPIVALQSVDS